VRRIDEQHVARIQRLEVLKRDIAAVASLELNKRLSSFNWNAGFGVEGDDVYWISFIAISLCGSRDDVRRKAGSNLNEPSGSQAANDRIQGFRVTRLIKAIPWPEPRRAPHHRAELIDIRLKLGRKSKLRISIEQMI